jgi:peptidoglycan hydrolase FlgJ
MALRGSSVDASAALALDANALSSLKQQAKRAPAEALSKAAGQFEALFVSMVLKSMRDALPQDGPFASETTKTYTAMFDRQLAMKLSERGIGLRKALEKQLARSLPAAPPEEAAPTPGSTPRQGSDPAATRARTGSDPALTPNRPEQGLIPSKERGLAPSPTTFIEKLRPHAEAAAKALGVPVQFLLAQAGLETGWGKSQPKTADGASSHNLFGIKTGRRWSGAIAPARTTEYVQGNPIRSTEQFRAYGSYAESFQDFVRLLRDNRRYADALSHGNDASRYAQSLQRAGYATDPAYADKLARAIALVTRHTRSPPSAQVMAGGADTRSDRA